MALQKWILGQPVETQAVCEWVLGEPYSIPHVTTGSWAKILTHKNIASSILDGDTTHVPDGNSVFDALALKSPIASPTFTGTVTMPASVVIPDGGTIGQVAGPLLNFDDTNNYLEITGCKVGIDDAVPAEKLDVNGNTNVTGVYKVDDVQVVSNQGLAVADATDAASVILRLNDLLARCRAHGLIATT